MSESKRTKRNVRKEHEAKKENERFMDFCNKVKERLTIIFEYNIPNEQSIIESDILLLREMKDWYDKSSIKWVKNDDIKTENYKQSQLYKDITSEKK